LELDEESNRKVGEYIKRNLVSPNEILDNRTILQANATVIVGVLFFLTLTSFVEFGSEEVGRVIVRILTTIIVVPFGVSAVMLVIIDIRPLSETFSKILETKRDIAISEWEYKWKMRMLKWARKSSVVGFAYLITVVLFFLYFAIAATYEESVAEECGRDPARFGVNQTHLWQCSMFSEGSLSEQCAKDPQRFHVNKTECSKFVPPI
jgi:low temperature requirement protein LtrA